jgi:hypothetical protein
MTCAQFQPDCIGPTLMAQAHEHRPTPDARGAGGTRPELPPVSEPARRFGRLWAALALAGLLVLGIGLGRVLDGGEAVAAGAAPAPASAGPPTVVTVPAQAPESCLTALHRSDATIVLLVHGVRDRRLADTLQSYMRASKACREEVSGR